MFKELKEEVEKVQKMMQEMLTNIESLKGDHKEIP